MAGFVADHGLSGCGICGSDPCRCVFVDRTRAGTRKYCCDYCNDRLAARAYRRRKSGLRTPTVRNRAYRAAYVGCEIRPLTIETWDAFKAFAAKHNGVWGGCWCA